jgi:hypothetical protein
MTSTCQGKSGISVGAKPTHSSTNDLNASCRIVGISYSYPRRTVVPRLPCPRLPRSRFYVPVDWTCKRRPTGPIRKHGAGGSLVVPMEELMRNLPLAIPLEQSEYVGSSGIGASQLA